jgi:hypothetical protein
MEHQMPQNGQIIVFTVPPAGSYLSAGEAYKVDMPKGAREFRFVSVARGSSAYAKAYTVAAAQWQVA